MIDNSFIQKWDCSTTDGIGIQGRESWSFATESYRAPLTIKESFVLLNFYSPSAQSGQNPDECVHMKQPGEPASHLLIEHSYQIKLAIHPSMARSYEADFWAVGSWPGGGNSCPGFEMGSLPCFIWTPRGNWRGNRRTRHHCFTTLPSRSGSQTHHSVSLAGPCSYDQCGFFSEKKGWQIEKPD